MRLCFPVDLVKITQRFGERPDVYKIFGLNGHNGIDFKTIWPDSKNGRRPIYAAAPGIVVKVFNQGDSGYGLYIIIQHEDGSETLYAHLSKILVKEKQWIAATEQIGISGTTGFSSAPHLHFGYFPFNTITSNGYGGAEDQSKLLINYPMTQKVYCALWKIPPNRDQIIREALRESVEWVKMATNGEFLIDLSVEDCSGESFTTDKYTGANGTDYSVLNYVAVKFYQVATLGQKAEASMDKEFDVVCLWYDRDSISPDKPTNPSDTNIFLDGFECLQIPVAPTAELRAMRETFVHEMLHGWYSILRNKGINLKDDVHLYGSTDEPRAEANYATLIQKLKPHWPLLTGEVQPSNDQPMPIDQKFIDKWKGHFILDVDDKGKCYYVNFDGKRMYLDPKQSLKAFADANKKVVTGFKHSDVLKIPE